MNFKNDIRTLVLILFFCLLISISEVVFSIEVLKLNSLFVSSILYMTLRYVPFQHISQL